MDYFLMEQSDYIKVKRKKVTETEEATICEVEELAPLHELDFLAEETLISDRLKLLFESFLPKTIWKAYVFIDRKKAGQEVFWHLNLPEYIPEKIEISRTGTVSGMQVDVLKVPRIFKLEQKNGRMCCIVHLSAAESMLRRGVLGLRLMPLCSDIT